MSIDRRKFLSLSTGAGALAMTPLENIFSRQAPDIPPAFSVKMMATDWGFAGSIDAFCAKAKQAGYDGIEVWWPGDAVAQTALFAALGKYKLQVGFLAGGGEKDPAKHLTQFTQAVNSAAYQKIQKPLYINCHSGRDYFSMGDNGKFITYTDKVAKETGVNIFHETHRGRMLFAAHVTEQYLEKYSGLRLTLDISHWCNVHESLLHDQEERVLLALQRTGHIHARVGHAEGPQVNDPRAPEWETVVKRHLGWWDAVVNRSIAEGLDHITILTEFGPPDYMPVLPYTRQPVADQWAINEYMMHLLRKRYTRA